MTKSSIHLSNLPIGMTIMELPVEPMNRLSAPLDAATWGDVQALWKNRTLALFQRAERKRLRRKRRQRRKG